MGNDLIYQLKEAEEELERLEIKRSSLINSIRLLKAAIASEQKPARAVSLAEPAEHYSPDSFISELDLPVPNTPESVAPAPDGLVAHSTAPCSPETCYPEVNMYSSERAKIALYMSLFHGRQDVFARRFESRVTGKSGYQPACSNEWIPGVCNKPKIKCSDCCSRAFIPLSDLIIRSHLTGRFIGGASVNEFVVGIYPLLPDDTCHFLAADFDKSDWQMDVSAFIHTCSEQSVPVAVERSRSGNGAHAWIFFSEPVPASDARKLGACILTRTMEKRPELGFGSYDRFFPNQDYMPKGGFGNLIALPLQKKVRTSGNSVFVDEEFSPYPDQWAFICSVKRMSLSDIRSITSNLSSPDELLGVRAFSEEESDKPWNWFRKDTQLVPEVSMKEKVSITISDQLYVDKDGLPSAIINRLQRIAAFQNPEFYRAQAMRLPNYNKPRIISCCEDFPKYIALPRGCLDDVLNLFSSVNAVTDISDQQYDGNIIDVSFSGKLKPEQQAAADEMLKHNLGILSATTAFGKTVTALYLLARRGVNTLILVHRQQLLEQWIERISTFLRIEKSSIGIIKAGKRKVTGIIDVALVQSLFKKGEVDPLVSGYGHVIVDECHHISSFSFERVIRHCRARYLLGLSATVERKDGQHPVIFMNLGPVRYKSCGRTQSETTNIIHRVIVRPSFSFYDNFEENSYSAVSAIYNALASDKSRNEMIIDDIVASVGEGRNPLVLTERKEHLEMLYKELSAKLPNVIRMKGGMGKKQRMLEEKKLSEVPKGKSRVIVATGKYIGEGYDDPCLDTLFLTMPVSWKGIIAQYAGRLHREHFGKYEVIIYDYTDVRSKVLMKMYRRRLKGYAAIGYSIDNPVA